MKTEESNQQQTNVNETKNAQSSQKNNVFKTSSKRAVNRASNRLFSDVLYRLIRSIFRR